MAGRQLIADRLDRHGMPFVHFARHVPFVQHDVFLLPGSFRHRIARFFGQSFHLFALGAFGEFGDGDLIRFDDAIRQMDKFVVDQELRVSFAVEFEIKLVDDVLVIEEHLAEGGVFVLLQLHSLNRPAIDNPPIAFADLQTFRELLKVFFVEQLPLRGQHKGIVGRQIQCEGEENDWKVMACSHVVSLTRQLRH